MGWFSAWWLIGPFAIAVIFVILYVLRVEPKKKQRSFDPSEIGIDRTISNSDVKLGLIGLDSGYNERLALVSAKTEDS
jgi:hypothetical protein